MRDGRNLGWKRKCRENWGDRADWEKRVQKEQRESEAAETCQLPDVWGEARTVISRGMKASAAGWISVCRVTETDGRAGWQKPEKITPSLHHTQHDSVSFLYPPRFSQSSSVSVHRLTHKSEIMKTNEPHTHFLPLLTRKQSMFTLQPKTKFGHENAKWYHHFLLIFITILFTGRIINAPPTSQWRFCHRDLFYVFHDASEMSFKLCKEPNAPTSHVFKV